MSLHTLRSGPLALALAPALALCACAEGGPPDNGIDGADEVLDLPLGSFAGRVEASLGVGNDDVVRIISPYGEMEASVVVYPGIRPDVIAVPVGQREGDFGRFADRRGKNPVSLVSPVSDPDTGSLAWGATRVRVMPTGEKKSLARLESLDGDGRETIS